MHNKKPNGTCRDTSIVMERNRYFTGKYMTARDFQGEQTYFLNRHRLHNRLLHGWGIVCGLRVKPHPDPNCQKEWVVIRAGIAIDCYGREIVLPKDTPFKLPPLPELIEEKIIVHDEAVAEELEAVEQDSIGSQKIRRKRYQRPGSRNDWNFLVGIQYIETPIEPVPVLYNEGTCDPTHQEANRLQEAAKIVILRWDEVSPDCWKMPNGDPDSHCHHDCDEPLPGIGGICLEPECPCGNIVPLARLEFDPDDQETGFEIDTNGRRQLPLAPEFHTHITHINWPHGETVVVDDIHEWNRQLRIRFDRPLRKLEKDDKQIDDDDKDDYEENEENEKDEHSNVKYDVDEYTFVVQYGGVQQDLEFLPGKVTVEEDGRVAVFTVAENFSRGGIEDLVRNVIHITLKCDFILDCHENPVDGNHMKGMLPSGNGTLGGTFESWFFVDTRQRDRKGRKNRRAK